ncbi:uncharacterized protein LOC121374269 [Gigantopelta aegis]|uniref:uncharacterized protein LOC121374269 n=1 Tax=Gigantopelta aegis TaxID=1735272 RepID=UPI001B888B7E|nr:uncharacterized protein LOC121374269 [Gigantopelta aegis]
MFMANNQSMMFSKEMGNVTNLEEGSRLQAYSVVLSATTLLLSALAGGGGSLAVMFTIVTGKVIEKQSYAIVLTLLAACLAFDLLWAPLEIVHLLYYHHTNENVTQDYKVMTHGIYVFLIMVISSTVILVSAKKILCLYGKFGKKCKKVWPTIGCFVSLFLGLVAVSVYVSTVTIYEGNFQDYFPVMNKISFCFKAIMIGLMMLAVLVMMTVVITIAVAKQKNHDDGFHSNSESKNTIPQVLIAETDVTDDESETPSAQGGSPLPLLTINTDGEANRGDNSSTVGELPNPSKNKNMLGVNMAHILGRRRHTICQIGDSSTNLMDPAEKAKKYTYIRKFSVDISALQAQLENPKIFSGKAPFQSDTDVSKKESPNPIVRAPLIAPILKLDERTQKCDFKNETRPVLPVITVSDDEGQEKEDEVTDNDDDDESEKPILTFKLPNLTEEMHHDDDDKESVHSSERDQSVTDHDEAFVKLSCLFSTAFCLCMLPLFLTEVLRYHLITNAYINISTCTMALSAIQTIIYPQIIICMDSIVHKAVNQLWRNIKWRLSCKKELAVDTEANQDHGSTSTSQV